MRMCMRMFMLFFLIPVFILILPLVIDIIIQTRNHDLQFIFILVSKLTAQHGDQLQ